MFVFSSFKIFLTQVLNSGCQPRSLSKNHMFWKTLSVRLTVLQCHHPKLSEEGPVGVYVAGSGGVVF